MSNKRNLVSQQSLDTLKALHNAGIEHANSKGDYANEKGDLAQAAAIEAFISSDINTDYISYTVGQEPDSTGAADGTIGAYFTNTGLFQKVQLDDSAWSPIGSPLATEQSVAEKASLLREEMNAQPVDIPDGFSYTPLFNIYRTTNGYTADLDVSDYEPETDETFYLSPDGDDSNDGLSEANPKESIRTLIDDLNDSGTYDSVTFILASGVWDQSNTWTTDVADPEFDLVIKCSDGRAAITLEHPDSITWTETTGRDNVWEFDVGSGSGPYFAYDKSYKDDHNRFIRPTQVNSLSDCDSTPNSYYRDGTIVYVHTFGSREADSDVIVQRNSSAGSLSGAQFNKGGILFCENIDFWGGVNPIQADSSLETKIYLKNCTMAYGHESNGQEFDLTHSDSIVILQNCESFYNYLDGFSVRSSTYIELNCFAHHNGYSGGGANNASTTHDGAKSIRINCLYSDSEDRNVHDVGSGTESWFLNCASGNVDNDGDAEASFNFGFGSTGQDNTTKAWLEDCESLGGATVDLNVNGTEAAVKLRNFIKKGLKLINGSTTTY